LSPPPSGTLATINQLDPLRVVFSVSSNSPILSAVEGSAGAAFNVSIDLPDGSHYPYTGKIAFLDNQVDSSTGPVNVYS
jgi:membrane fusion protein (multidrug efflux system)